MCRPRVAPRSGRTCCCGCGYGPAFRRFFSSQEERESLESYQDQLQKELEGLKEHIKELESE